MKIFAETKEAMMIAWDAIVANKMRSMLATLGIVIGIVTVTLMGTVIDGLNRAFHDNISFIGADTLYVHRFGWTFSYEEWQAVRKRPRVTMDQAKAVRRQIEGVRAVAPVVQTGQPVVYKSKSAPRVWVVGTTDEYILTSGFTVEDGRFMTPTEAESGRAVCIIGTEIATNLFFPESPLGKRVKVGPRTLEVIGVLAKQGSFMGMESLDNQVIIPMRQFLMNYSRHPDVSIQVKVGDIAKVDSAMEELTGLMRKVRRVEPGAPDNFAINQQEQLVRMFHRLAGTIAGVALLITGLSLFVGGIGIMNIMFVSVTERTREIGVRKAIGAKRRTILIQFLIEAATICLLGGVVGILITYAVTLVVARFVPIPITLSVPVMVVALSVALVTGIVSGFLPAWRAARMDPVEALRNE